MKKKKEVLGTLCQELTCPGCGKLYNNSYLLPCEHSLCGNCLSKEIKPEKGGQIYVRCPSCKENFCFNQEDEVKFPENHLLNSTVTRCRQEGLNNGADSIKKKKRKPKGKVNPQQGQIFCQLCDEKDSHIAMKKCVNCNLNFCEKCLRKIHKNKAFLSHVLIDPSSGVEDQIKCFFHPFTNLRHYCIQDKLPICDECKLSTHRNHRLYSLDLAFQCEMAEMQKNVSQFTEVKVNFEKCIQQLKLMKIDMEQNEIQRNAEVSKDFLSLHEALKLQEQAIKDMIKVETAKKQNEVDQFFDSASTSMLRLEGLMLYTMEACKECRPAIFLQTSAQINKRLADITLCVTPNNSLAIIPFEDFELNVDHIKDAIDVLPSQLCETKSKHLCSGDFEMMQRLSVPYKEKKLKAGCSLQEASLNPMYSSFTSKIHAALITPNLDLCSCITRSCAVTFNSDASNVDSRADIPSLPCDARCASEDSLSVSSTKTALSDRASPDNSQSTSKAETTSNATEEGSCTHCGKGNEKSARVSDASSLDYCESVANSEHHHAPENSGEPQAETDYALSCASDPHASNIFQSAYFKNCELKGASSALYNPVVTEPSNNVLNISIEGECDDKSQDSNQCQQVAEKTISLHISEKTRPLPIWQFEPQDCDVRQSSGDAFSIELSPKGTDLSSNACSPEPENSKCLNDHESGDLSKDPVSSVISEQVAADSDTGISSSYNSSCLSSEKETEDYVPPFYQFCVPCTFTNAGPAQGNCANSGPEDYFDDEKGVPINICVNESVCQSEQSYRACNNAFSCVGPYFATGHGLPCKDMNLTSERESSEVIAVGCQRCHLSSSAGCMVDWNKREMSRSHESSSYDVVDDASTSNPARSWCTNNVPRNTRSRCKFGRRPSFRNPKLFSKSKSFLRGYPKTQTLNNVQFTPSPCCQSQSTSNFEISSNMSNEDLGNSRVRCLPRCATNDSVKGHSSTRFYHIGVPKSRNFRNARRTCPHLRPQSGIQITAVDKNQQHVCTTLERNVTVNQENGEMSQLSVQLHASSFLKQPTAALNRLPGAPKIYTHTVDGTSAKVKWMCPPVGKRTAYFFELQFQEIISVDKETAIPQDQAGVFSGIRRKNFVATNLNSNSEYLFRVRAVNMTGEGPWSQPYKILTVCGTVRNSENTKDKTVSLKGVKVTIHRSS